MDTMRKLWTTLCFTLAATFLLSCPSPSLSNGPADYVPDELIVKFKADAMASDMEALNAKIGAKAIRHFRTIDAHLLKLPKGLGVDKAIELFEQSPFVEYAEPNYIMTINATMPNDPRASELWGLHNVGQTGGTIDADIDAPEAWDITTGSSNTVIAVIDTGVDYNHEDLNGNIWVNPGEDLDSNGVVDPTDTNGMDDDGNGYVDDFIGWDFVNNDNDPYDDNNHGTHVSGTIAANGNNSTGVVGVNWTARIMALKFLSRLGFGSTSDAISAIEYHTAKGIKVSSNSWGGGGFTQALYDAIQACDCLFVAAAGNDGKNTDTSPHYPSAYDLINIVSVAATDHNDSRPSFSNYGKKTVDLGAPGANILSTTPGNTYQSFNGTSMATPHVAGVGGLLLSQDPNLTEDEMKWRLLKGVDPIGLTVLTNGRLNAYNSLAFGLATQAVTVDVIPVGSTTLSRGSTANYKVTLKNNTASAKSVTQTVFVKLPNGARVTLNGPTTVNLGASATVTNQYSKTIPMNAPIGDYTLVGAGSTSTSFDEDTAGYSITTN